MTPERHHVGRAHARCSPAGRRAGAAGRGGRREAAHRRRRAEETPFEVPLRTYDLGRLWRERTGLPMVFAVWASPSPAARASRPRGCARRLRSFRAGRPRAARLRVGYRYGYPAGFLARYFEKLRSRFGPRERARFYTFLELARDVGEFDEVPELRFVSAASAAV